MRYGILVKSIVPGAILTVITVASFAQNSTPATAKPSAFATMVREGKHPHLTVVISIDQFRSDYLRRLNDLLLPAKSGGKVGGFRYLMTAGSYFTEARFTHIPTYTGPGHSVILSGGLPYKTGIISNDWWDRATRSEVYCVDDARQTVVGAEEGSVAKPMGPLNLKATTVGDELKLATNGASKVVTIALKDRAAILLGGHAQDVSLWYDPANGNWISSTAYCKNGKLPEWAQKLNSEKTPDKTAGTTWNLSESLTPEKLSRALPANLPATANPSGIGRVFPHKIPAITDTAKRSSFYRAFVMTPDANAYVFETAKRAVNAEKLGSRGEIPDLLALNLSTNDYVGHAFGPYSPEALDLTLRTDNQLSDFLNFLQKAVPGGLNEVVFVVTADHGVAPIPENLTDKNISAGRVNEALIESKVQDTLSKEFGVGIWTGKDRFGKQLGQFNDPYLYLNDELVKQTVASGKATRAQIETAAARAISEIPGIYSAYSRTQVLEGRLPQTDISSHIYKGFHPKLSGDVVVVTEPNFFIEGPGGTGTTHGSPYNYDTHVPILIAGPGIRPGVWADPVSPADIASTLCLLLGIEAPSANDGTPLKSALQP